MERDDIIKALECCRGKGCKECPYRCGDATCISTVASDALSLIKKLTEDVERVRKQCGEIIVECDERDAERSKDES